MTVVWKIGGETVLHLLILQEFFCFRGWSSRQTKPEKIPFPQKVSTETRGPLIINKDKYSEKKGGETSYVPRGVVKLL